MSEDGKTLNSLGTTCTACRTRPLPVHVPLPKRRRGSANLRRNILASNEKPGCSVGDSQKLKRFFRGGSIGLGLGASAVGKALPEHIPVKVSDPFHVRSDHSVRLSWPLRQ